MRIDGKPIDVTGIIKARRDTADGPEYQLSILTRQEDRARRVTITETLIWVPAWTLGRYDR
jgi:hypothetical protein